MFRREYVVGFAFNEDMSKVLLIRKNRPEWQAGKLNGVGGKIEDKDDTISHAMTREFLEEANIFVSPDKWQLFCTQKGPKYRVYKFYVKGVDITAARSMTDEKLYILDLDEIGWERKYNILQNLSWAINFILDDSVGFATIQANK